MMRVAEAEVDVDNLILRGNIGSRLLLLYLGDSSRPMTNNMMMDHRHQKTLNLTLRRDLPSSLGPFRPEKDVASSLRKIDIVILAVDPHKLLTRH